jgi:Rad3-related DNA helicase
MDSFVRWLMKLHGTMDEYLSEQEVALPVRDDILEFYFEIGHFLQIYELLDENYVNYTQIEEDGRFMIRLFCVNPAQNLKQCMAKGRSSILFSATLLPIQYYKKLLGGEEGDYEIYATSIFRPEKKALLIANDVTSKFTRRTEEEYEKIATYIEEIVKNRHGNYLVFCPSFAFMRTVPENQTKDTTQLVGCVIKEASTAAKHGVRMNLFPIVETFLK